MVAYALSVDPPAAMVDQETDGADADHTFHWHRAASTPYFHASVGPLLGDLGAVHERNIDLVRIAAGVLAADRSLTRSGSLSRWNQREFNLRVDVLDADAWAPVADRLAALLGFLTGDRWRLHFRTRHGATETIASVGIDASRVVLLSGGADSASGALLSASELADRNEQQILVSHWSSTNLSPLQSRIAARIEDVVAGSTADHVKVNLARGRTAPTGAHYGRENSTRSRSLLFIALGLAVASAHRVPLWLPENGYASINPPLSKSRRGSLSTKTTHPKFLADLAGILKIVGAHHDVVNPFASWTKGEMFLAVRDRIGTDAASQFLSATSSCSHSGARSWGYPPETACGECFGCVLRKASFLAAELDDTTPYLTPATPAQAAWLAERSVLPAMRDFLSEPFGERDLVPLQIPSTLPLAVVNYLCQRGRSELRAAVDACAAPPHPTLPTQ
jgi:hypothetical protein